MDKISISKSEAKVFGAAQLQANASAKKISQESGIAEHSVRYVLKKYIDSGILVPRAVLNPERLGYTVYVLLFSVTYESSVAEQQLRQALVDSELTVSVFDLGGDYHYGAVMYAQEITEIYDFVSSLAGLAGVTLIDKSLALRISTTLLRRRYLTSEASAVEEISFGQRGAVFRIDELDHLILKGITHSQHSSRRALARSINVPHSTVESRIHRLEEAGVIVGYAYGIRSTQFGMEASRVLIRAKGDPKLLWEQIRNLGRKHPHVVQVTRMLGGFDFDILLETFDPKQVVEITREIHEALGPEVVAAKSLPVYGYLKFDEYPFS